MTKTDQIKNLLGTTDMTRAEIAKKVGCLPDYVRVVEQRAAGNNAAERYRKRDLPRAAARKLSYFQRNPHQYEKQLERNRAYWRKKKASTDHD